MYIRVYMFKDTVYLGSVALYYMGHFNPPPLYFIAKYMNK